MKRRAVLYQMGVGVWAGLGYTQALNIIGIKAQDAGGIIGRPTRGKAEICHIQIRAELQGGYLVGIFGIAKIATITGAKLRHEIKPPKI